MIDKQQEFIAKQKLWRQQDMEILMQKNDLLTMLDRQSKDWLTPQNIEEKLETELNNLLPPIIASHKDYYNRLVKFSFNIEQGKFEDAEDLKINKKIVEYKNKLLSPLYQELKTIIKYLTINEENAAFDLYKETINRLKSKYNSESDPELKNLMQKISYDFKKLITLIRLENEKPENKLNLVENQLKSLVMILVVWNKYTDLIYKNEDDIEEEIELNKKLSFHTKQRLAGKSLDELLKENNPEKVKNFYLQRITEKKGKGKGLFISEFLGLYDNPELRRKMDKLELEEIKRIDSKDYNNPKYANLFTEEESEAKKEKATNNANQEKLSTSKKSSQHDKSEKNAIKKARNFDITETSNKEDQNEADAVDSEKDTKKKSKKERAEVESSDMKMKKKKKASISETKRKMLENEATQVFQDEEDLSEDEFEEAEKTAESLKAKNTQEEIERNRKQLEEFELANEAAAENAKGEKIEINEKLKEYYEGIKTGNTASQSKKAEKDTKNAADTKKAHKKSNEDIESNEENDKDSKKTIHIAAEILERSVKHQINCKIFSVLPLKLKKKKYFHL